MKFSGKAFFKHKPLVFFLLSRFPTQFVREFYGEEFLSPIECFALSGYNEKIYNNLNLTSESTAIVVGGYLGNSVSKLIQKYPCKILIVEPVPEYTAFLRNKFIDFKQVSICELALSDRSGRAYLQIKGESSNIVTSNDLKSIEVTTESASVFIQSIAEKIDFLELNIEGSEYVVLKDLINSAQIQNIQNIAIQFHKKDEYSELMRADLRFKLSKTHIEAWNHEWVWEFWTKL